MQEYRGSLPEMGRRGRRSADRPAEREQDEVVPYLTAIIRLVEPCFTSERAYKPTNNAGDKRAGRGMRALAREARRCVPGHEGAPNHLWLMSGHGKGEVDCVSSVVEAGASTRYETTGWGQLYRNNTVLVFTVSDLIGACANYAE